MIEAALIVLPAVIVVVGVVVSLVRPRDEDRDVKVATMESRRLPR